MASRLMSSLARCSIPRVSFISRSQSQFYSTTPLISATLILRNLISKPCCAISIKSASSTSLASENDRIKPADENLLLVLESVIAKKNLNNVWPKDFQFEVTDNPGDNSITLKREYHGEQIQAEVSRERVYKISLVVTIDKKLGHTLEFCCDLTPSAFEIESMSLKSSENSEEYYYQRPDLSDLDKRLHKVFDEYLAARGFTKFLYDCLHYRIDGLEYFPWQGLKEFIEK